ncbi:response regulator transcription factor [Saccharothrix sp. AJ9571]|nr:response regulator transcription factor [Saccharothrix sp. AJ9571]
MGLDHSGELGYTVTRTGTAGPARACWFLNHVTGGTMAVKMLVIDPHPVSRASVTAMLSSTGQLEVLAGVAPDRQAVQQAVARESVVIILPILDNMPEQLARVRRLRAVRTTRESRIVLLGEVGTATAFVEVVEAGVNGCVSPIVAQSQLVAAVTLIAGGATVFLPEPPRMPCEDVQAESFASRPGPGEVALTERERAVLGALGKGLSNGEIAQYLHLAETTVKKHLTQAMRKIGVPSRLRAGLYARRHYLHESEFGEPRITASVELRTAAERLARVPGGGGGRVG